VVLQRWTVRVLMVFLAFALLASFYVHSPPSKPISYTRQNAASRSNTSFTVPATLVPMITAVIAAPDLTVTAILNAPVHRGDPIGLAPVMNASGETEYSGSELADANREIAQAEEALRQVSEELNAKEMEIGTMRRQEISAAAGELEAEEELACRTVLFRSGLASEFDYDAAASVRASAQAALNSVRSKIAITQVEIDEFEARQRDARARLADAVQRRNAAQSLMEPQRANGAREPVVAPADGLLVANSDPENASIGIASDPARVYAYTELRQSERASMQIGQPVLIVLDAEPSATLRATVRSVSGSPVDLNGNVYRVGLSIESPGGRWFTGVAVHLRFDRFPR
jgi:HlyD family secretion protein